MKIIKAILTLIIIVLGFWYSIGIEPYYNYQMTKLDSLSVINNYIESHKFTHDKRLQDAGDFDHRLDTSIQRKVFNLKLKTDENDYSRK